MSAQEREHSGNSAFSKFKLIATTCASISGDLSMTRSRFSSVPFSKPHMQVEFSNGELKCFLFWWDFRQVQNVLDDVMYSVMQRCVEPQLMDDSVSLHSSLQLVFRHNVIYLPSFLIFRSSTLSVTPLEEAIIPQSDIFH